MTSGGLKKRKKEKQRIKKVTESGTKTTSKRMTNNTENILATTVDLQAVLLCSVISLERYPNQSAWFLSEPKTLASITLHSEVISKPIGFVL